MGHRRGAEQASALNYCLICWPTHIIRVERDIAVCMNQAGLFGPCRHRPFNVERLRVTVPPLCHVGCRWDLVAINPSAVFGPPVTGRADGTSLEIFQKAFNGEFSAACPDMGERTDLAPLLDAAG